MLHWLHASTRKDEILSLQFVASSAFPGFASIKFMKNFYI